MEWWFIAFFKIILINIILSGDNAIVIAMSSRNLPEKQRRIAIFWGAFGAVALRIILTLVAVQLLKIPFLTAIGALLLVWIAIKLITNTEDHGKVQASSNLSSVVMTIIIADFVMSLDNAIAIAAVAEGNFILIIIGLILSIPIIVWGSGIILRLLKTFPRFIYLGAAILGFTAGEMFMTDQKVWNLLGHVDAFFHWALPIVTAIGVVVLGSLWNNAQNRIFD